MAEKSVPSVRSALLSATLTPSIRTQGPLFVKRSAALVALLASQALKVPLNPPAAARAWHTASPAARPVLSPAPAQLARLPLPLTEVKKAFLPGEAKTGEAGPAPVCMHTTQCVP